MKRFLRHPWQWAVAWWASCVLVGVLWAGAGAVTFAWDMPAAAQASVMEYHVYRQIDGKDGFALQGRVRSPIQQYVDSSMVAGHTYRWYVTAATTQLESKPSNVLRLVCRVVKAQTQCVKY